MNQATEEAYPPRSEEGGQVVGGRDTVQTQSNGNEEYSHTLLEEKLESQQQSILNEYYNSLTE